MKSIWKGSIAFGLVNIPVRLYSATESQSLASHMLHKKDLSRIRFQRVAESTGKEVRAEEIVKGYEVEKNQCRLAFGLRGDVVEYAIKMRKLQDRYFMLGLLQRDRVGMKDLDRVVSKLKAFYEGQRPTEEVTM
jgi:hypothetical protein